MNWLPGAVPIPTCMPILSDVFAVAEDIQVLATEVVLKNLAAHKTDLFG